MLVRVVRRSLLLSGATRSMAELAACEPFYAAPSGGTTAASYAQQAHAPSGFHEYTLVAKRDAGRDSKLLTFALPETMPTLGARRCRLQPVETPRPVRGIPALKRPQARTAISRDRSQRDVVLHVQPEQCPTFLGANAPTLGRGIRIRRGVHQVTLRGRPAASAAWLCWGLG